MTQESLLFHQEECLVSVSSAVHYLEFYLCCTNYQSMDCIYNCCVLLIYHKCHTWLIHCILQECLMKTVIMWSILIIYWHAVSADIMETMWCHHCCCHCCCYVLTTPIYVNHSYIIFNTPYTTFKYIHCHKNHNVTIVKWVAMFYFLFLLYTKPF